MACLLLYKQVRLDALTHLRTCTLFSQGGQGAITCKQWLFCFCHRLKCQLWRWIWPQSEEQTKYAQVRFCVNRAAESLRSMSALRATRCHVNEQVGRGSGGLAFSLQCCNRLSTSCKPVLKVCKCFQWKLPLDTCGRKVERGMQNDLQQRAIKTLRARTDTPRRHLNAILSSGQGH